MHPAHSASVLESLEARQLLSVTPAHDPAHPNGVLIPGVPLYDWYYGCEPSSVAMILGYWDSHGYPNIFPGDASTMTSAVKTAIADAAHKTAGQENKPRDALGRYWGWGDWHNSLSYPNHEHGPNSLADWLKTRDGTSVPGQLPLGTEAYLASRGYGGWRIERFMFPDVSFSAMAAEINAKHPMEASVDSNGDGVSDHAITVVGYDPTTSQYAALNEFDTTARWYAYKPMAKGQKFGIQSLWPVDPPASGGPHIELLSNRWALDPRGQTTSTVDGTDFGAWSGVTQTFTILNGGDRTLALPSANAVAITGANAGDFVLTKKPALSVAPGASTTFSVKFIKRANGSRSAAITVRSSDGATPAFKIKVRGGSQPFYSKPAAIPTTIQAEDYDRGREGNGYHDTTAANLGGIGVYRPWEGVDIGGSAGAYYVDFTQPGEWLAYSINAPTAGVFRFDASIASQGKGGRFHITLDGQPLGAQLAIPDTGGWTKWRTIGLSGLRIAPGQHTVRVVFDAAGASGYVGNVDWLSFVRTGS